MRETDDVTDLVNAQLVKDFCAEDHNKKLAISSVLIGLRALQKLSAQYSIPIEKIDRKLLFKEFLEVDLTESDIQNARTKVQELCSFLPEAKDYG